MPHLKTIQPPSRGCVLQGSNNCKERRCEVCAGRVSRGFSSFQMEGEIAARSLHNLVKREGLTPQELVMQAEQLVVEALEK